MNTSSPKKYCVSISASAGASSTFMQFSGLQYNFFLAALRGGRERGHDLDRAVKLDLASRKLDLICADAEHALVDWLIELKVR